MMRLHRISKELLNERLIMQFIHEPSQILLIVRQFMIACLNYHVHKIFPFFSLRNLKALLQN